MVSTPSTMLPLGTKAPDFSLPDAEGSVVSLDDLSDAGALLVVFVCNHCPYVKHLAPALGDFERDYRDRGLQVVAIGANDAERYPDDAPERNPEAKRRFGWEFPYLFDGSQSVAKAYRAACTPDFFLFDSDRRLAYRGRFDASRPKNDEPVTGADLRRAADTVLEGKTVPEEQVPSVGCNIKWKEGNAPDYFGA